METNTPNPELKGVYGGNCNRTACQKPNAVYYNHSTKLYYCEECAILINDANAWDAHKLYGHPLCMLGKFNPMEAQAIDNVPLVVENYPVGTQVRDLHNFNEPKESKPIYTKQEDGKWTDSQNWIRYSIPENEIGIGKRYEVIVPESSVSDTVDSTLEDLVADEQYANLSEYNKMIRLVRLGANWQKEKDAAIIRELIETFEKVRAIPHYFKEWGNGAIDTPARLAIEKAKQHLL